MMSLRTKSCRSAANSMDVGPPPTTTKERIAFRSSAVTPGKSANSKHSMMRFFICGGGARGKASNEREGGGKERENERERDTKGERPRKREREREKRAREKERKRAKERERERA